MSVTGSSAQLDRRRGDSLPIDLIVLRPQRAWRRARATPLLASRPSDRSIRQTRSCSECRLAGQREALVVTPKACRPGLQHRAWPTDFARRVAKREDRLWKLWYGCDPAAYSDKRRGRNRIQELVGARDLNPGPHGPEIYAVSSTDTVVEGFELISTSQPLVSTEFHPPDSPGLLHELLHTPSASSVPRLREFREDPRAWLR